MTDQGLSAAYLRKASRCLASARALSSGGDTEGACNRAYYAMHNAAHAALLSAAAGDPAKVYKTHSGLIAAFGQHIVTAARMNPELGRQLNQVEHLRLRADYIGDPPSLADTRQAVAQAEAFVAAILAVSEALASDGRLPAPGGPLMPIRRTHRHVDPIDGPQLSAAIRFARVGSVRGVPSPAHAGRAAPRRRVMVDVEATRCRTAGPPATAHHASLRGDAVRLGEGHAGCAGPRAP